MADKKPDDQIEAKAFKFLGDHRFAPFLRAAIQFVAFVLALYAGFLLQFGPPAPVRDMAIGLLCFYALLIALTLQLIAKAHPLWEQGLWWIAGVSIAMLMVFTYGYASAAMRYVVVKPNTGEHVIVGDRLLDSSKCDGAGGEDDIGKCVEQSASVFALFGRPQILAAQETLLFRYLLFGGSLFLSLATVLEALVWTNLRAKQGVTTDLRADG